MGQNSENMWNGSQAGRGSLFENGGYYGGFNNNNGGFTGGSHGFERRGGRGSITCQICFKNNHSAADCKNRFNRNFVPNFSAQNYAPNQYQAPRSTYMTTSEGVADQGWYLDSGATHYLT